MQWARVRNLSVRRSKVNGNLKTNLATPKDIIKEGDTLLDNHLANDNLHWLILQLYLHLLKSGNI